MMNKTTTLRFSDADKRLLKLFSERLGITQTAVVRQAIRLLARKEGIGTKRVEENHV